MTDKERALLHEEIFPAIESGNVMLFIGAGFSVGTQTVQSKVPSSDELKKMLCEAIKKKIPTLTPDKIDLQDTFKLAKTKIPNFEDYLIKIFDVTHPFPWQIDLLRYWWRGIYSTNIDTVLEKCVNILNKQGKDITPKYNFFGHRDIKPILSNEIERNIVCLHGTITRPKDGFIFDRAAYADYSAAKPDWLRDVAANISSGNCLFLGSRFKEPDIDVLISERTQIHENCFSTSNNWIVLKSFEDYERELYEERGIIPIQSDIKSFVDYVTENIRPLSQKAFLKKRLPHLHMPEGNLAPFAWFSKSFGSVPEMLDNATQTHCLRGLFYSGDPVSWAYIVHNAPADLSFVDSIYESITEAIGSSVPACVINVTGPICSGKTTATMMALKRISITNKSVYAFSSENGIDIEFFWRAIKDLKGDFVFYFDNGYEHFYAIDELIKRSVDLPGRRKFVFVVESRSAKFEYHQRHFKSIPPELISNIELKSLKKDDAEKIINKLDILGVIYPKFKDKTIAQRISMILDKQKGYGGDLFAALYDLSHSSSYEVQIRDEYKEVSTDTARKIFNVLLIATSIRINFPLAYLSEICEESVNSILNIFSTELRGKTKKSDTTNSISTQHHSISNFIVKNVIEKNSLYSSIDRILSVVSKKFKVEDIKYHPLPFRIYRELISYKFLTELAFDIDRDLLLYLISIRMLKNCSPMMLSSGYNMGAFMTNSVNILRLCIASEMAILFTVRHIFRIRLGMFY